MARAPLRIILEVVVATALTWTLGGVYFAVVQGAALADAFLVRSVGQVLGFVDIAIVTWLIVLVVGEVRGRGLGWSLGSAVLAAVIGAVVNLVWIVILSAAGGGVDPLALALGVVAGLFFIVSAVLSLLLVRHLIPQTSKS